MKCYSGTKPYIFISYSHKDVTRVSPVIEELINRGYRVWYDYAIEPSEEWPEVVAARLYNAESVLFFVSKNFNDSKNCRREVNFSVDKDKDGMTILLDDAELSLGLQMQLNSYQSIPYRNDLELIEFVNKLLDNKVISKPQLVMDKDEFIDFINVDMPTNGLINQMVIAIGIVKHDNAVLMTKRKKKEGDLLWGFPATMIKPDENIEQRIEKEVYAETGAKTHFMRYLGERIHPDTKTITYYCSLQYESGEIYNKDEYENAETRWVSIDEYENYITSNLFGKVKEYLEETMVEVVVCIVIHEKKVLLVHRKVNDEKLAWVFPGGTVENGETIEETAIRELKEETNIDGSVELIIGERTHPKTKKEMAYVALEPKTFVTKLGDEDLDDVRWVDIATMSDYIGNGLYERVAEYIHGKLGL